MYSGGKGKILLIEPCYVALNLILLLKWTQRTMQETLYFKTQFLLSNPVVKMNTSLYNTTKFLPNFLWFALRFSFLIEPNPTSKIIKPISPNLTITQITPNWYGTTHSLWTLSWHMGVGNLMESLVDQKIEEEKKISKGLNPYSFRQSFQHTSE